MAEEINIYLCEPRSFCFGVTKAIDMVNEAIKKYGPPVYILNEIVHNRHVVEELKSKGAVFITSMSDADKSRPLIFSAHGVSKAIENEAKSQIQIIIDATCPLVKKVHKKVKELDEKGCNIIIIGKENHPEIIGTKGQIFSGSKALVVSSKEDIEKLKITGKTAYVTQTTLSVDETKDIAAALKLKFPDIYTMNESDICFATTQRQAAVKNAVKKASLIIVIGSKNSSNSTKLKEISLSNGAEEAMLIDSAGEIDWKILDSHTNIGITAGASAPEHLVQEIIEALRKRYEKINIQSVNI
ncbi:MAG: 4-hydroxy-3-methylbut-2-enyl diphosphate reductase [Lactobacillaceae bacterium]|jgi:4-hydroxy-3-methylbut-2-enyl diphosphate reductase|nr:4-hydroxy-3-methylbut-2-enyl diphosphate reductase [Lactobacillaceae bacterium]